MFKLLSFWYAMKSITKSLSRHDIFELILKCLKQARSMGCDHKSVLSFRVVCAALVFCIAEDCTGFVVYGAYCFLLQLQLWLRDSTIIAQRKTKFYSEASFDLQTLGVYYSIVYKRCKSCRNMQDLSYFPFFPNKLNQQPQDARSCNSNSHFTNSSHTDDFQWWMDPTSVNLLDDSTYDLS